jgi:hypothetical protein
MHHWFKEYKSCINTGLLVIQWKLLLRNCDSRKMLLSLASLRYSCSYVFYTQIRFMAFPCPNTPLGNLDLQTSRMALPVL